MKKVRIISGIYGWQPNEDGKKAKGDDKKPLRRTVPIPRGGTVDVTDSEARRLVEMKVAEYVTETAETAEAAEPKAPEVNGGMPDLNADGDVV